MSFCTQLMETLFLGGGGGVSTLNDAITQGSSYLCVKVIIAY